MVTIEKLKFTKFLYVKSPLGIIQKGETLENYSIGIDLYIPKFTTKFFEAIVESNLDENKNSKLFFNQDSLVFVNALTGELAAEIIEDKMRVYQAIQIPTGIGILLPQNCYALVDSKSSNFKLGWTEVTGKIDMNYTYGMGVQLIPIEVKNAAKLPVYNYSQNGHGYFTLQQDQKFAQLIIREAVPVLEMQEVELNDWNQSYEVQKLRQVRTGGFGSEGKL